MAQAKTEGGVMELVKTIFWALVIAGAFRTLFFQPFWIPSSSMKDTLLVGDFVFVNKMAYGYSRYSCPFAMCPFSGRLFGSEPERGDVVVFRHPAKGDDLIKRLIGEADVHAAFGHGEIGGRNDAHTFGTDVDSRTGVEIQGGVYNRGRHVTGSGYERDCRKYNLAYTSGWTIFLLTSQMAKDAYWHGLIAAHIAALQQRLA